MIRLLVLAVLTLGLSRGDEPSLADLVATLSSDDFQERRSAMETIRTRADAHPEETLNQIPKLLKNLNDPEAKLRLRKVAQDIKVKPTKALFGFSFELDRTSTLDGKPVTGVKLLRVQPGTPAERDGLKANDIILAVDGKSFPREISEFSVRVTFAEQTPEEKVTLVVERHGETIDLQVSPKEEPLNSDAYNPHLNPFDPLFKEERLKNFNKWLQDEIEK